MAEDCDGHQLRTSSTVTSSPQHGGCQMKVRTGRSSCSSSSSIVGSYCKRRSLKQLNCDDVTTVVTCEGDIDDPQFHVRFEQLMTRLKTILMQDREDWLKVNKIEPWNSVRVTLTIPREAAQRLRSLAAAGDSALQALGILSVQVEGDQVISLQLRSRFGGEPQEILLTTSNTEPGSSCAAGAAAVSQILGAPVGSCSQSTSNSVFRSPNVVAPGGAGIPPSAKMPPSTGPSPYPFTSMTHAAQAQQSRDSMSTHQNFTPPPPYPVNNYSPAPPATVVNSKIRQHNSVTSSPLLVNLLQNDGTTAPSPQAPTTTITSTTPATATSLTGDQQLKTVRKLSPTGEVEGVNKPRPAVIQPQPPQRVPAPPPPSVRHRAPVQVNKNSVVQQQPAPPPPPQPVVNMNNMMRSRFNGPTIALPPPPPPPPCVAKQFQQNQPQPIVSTRPAVQRFSQIRPVIQGYSQFTANKNKTVTESTSTEVKAEVNSDKKLIINPLTGELEPVPSESSESETEDHTVKEDPFLYSPSPGSRVFSDEESTPSQRRLDGGSDDSDTDYGVSSVKRRNSSLSKHGVQEKIKLRLKLEKCEPVNQSYKVDVSFINSPTPRKALPVTANRTSNTSSNSSSSSSSSSSSGSTVASNSSGNVNVTSSCSNLLPNNTEEPRVPPLHISLRGRNAAVVKQSVWNMDDDDDDDEDEEEEEQVINNSTTTSAVTPAGGVVTAAATTGAGVVTLTTSCSQQQQQQVTSATLSSTNNNNNTSASAVSVTGAVVVDYHKVNRKKVRTGREEFAIGGYKKTKLKNDILKLKIPTYNIDDGIRVKRKESKKSKVKQIIEEETIHNLKMDSEEFISRTLKEGINLEKRKNNKLLSGASDDSNDRTMKDKHKKLSLKIKNDYKQVTSVCGVESELGTVGAATVATAIDAVTKKPQEIGGKIKSELSSKIDRVSGKLKNDLSLKVTKDGSCKKLKEDKISVVRKLVGGVVEHEGFTKGRRRHSGDSTAESQAQKVKNRSSSSDQLLATSAVQSSTLSATPTNLHQTQVRRVESFTRRIRKESVIDRLRRDKLNKVFGLNGKSSIEQQNSKRVHSNNVNMLALKQQQQQQQPRFQVQAQSSQQTNSNVLGVVDGPVKELTNLEEVTNKTVKDEEAVVQAGGGESPANQGNTQGEDSGIESMDALSEKSPNQGESPCRSERKEDESQKELDISKPEEKKGQNHDRTKEGDSIEGTRKSCLIEEEEEELEEVTTPSSTTIKSAAVAAPTTGVAETSSSAVAQGEHTSITQVDAVDEVGDYPLDKRLTDSFEVKIREAFLAQAQEGLAAKIMDTAKEVDCEDVLDRFRVNPPLYTYAKREDSLSPSPTNIDCPDLKCAPETLDEDSNTSSVSSSKKQTLRKVDRKKQQAEVGSDADEASNTSTETQATVRSLRGNKSLLEQLLIEIPPEETRRTRSWPRLGGSPGNTPKSSPRSPRPSPTGSVKGKRKTQADAEDNHRPNKRKCSENAAELIKACMGVDEKKLIVNNKIASPVLVTKKVVDVDSSDDEPLIDLAGKNIDFTDDKLTLKNKTKLHLQDEENKNNNKTTVLIKQLTPTPPLVQTHQQQSTPAKVSEVQTRRSVRQNNNGTSVKQDVRSLRSTRSTSNPVVESEVNKRRRTSRDGK